MGNIKVFTSFSGYDSQCIALNRIGVDYELVGWCDIDKNAIKAHDALFPESKEKNYGDISKIDWENVPDFDLFTMSSPCQDFSKAGMMAGCVEGSGTRSSLLWECRKAIQAKKPKIIFFENVANVYSKRFRPFFEKWKEELSGMGYVNHDMILNASDFGISQNRERLYMVSLLGEHTFELEKGTDERKEWKESNVEEQYYLNADQVSKMNVFEEDGKVFIKQATKAGRIEIPFGGVFDGSFPESKTRRGRVQRNGQLSATLMASGEPLKILEGRNEDGSLKIRNMTERECFRLMGLENVEIEKIANVVDPKNMRKLAGNSIVVDVIVALLKNILK